jgi:alpha/beta superfamily hydrolase
MIGEASILNALPFEHSRPAPIQWSSVQGIMWQTNENKSKSILVANLSEFKQTVWIGVDDFFSNKLKKIGSSNGMGIEQQMIKPAGELVSVELEPWELAAILE